MLQSKSRTAFNLLWVLMAIAVFHMFGCGGAPVKPSVELGVLDVPSGEVIVNMTGGKALSSINSVSAASYSNVARAIASSGNRVPLASYDRAIAFKPAYWKAVQDYMNSLVRYIQNHCSGN